MVNYVCAFKQSELRKYFIKVKTFVKENIGDRLKIIYWNVTKFTNYFFLDKPGSYTLTNFGSLKIQHVAVKMVNASIGFQHYQKIMLQKQQ